RNLQLAFELDRVASGQAEQRQLHVVPPRQRLHLWHGSRRDADDVTTRRFGEERGVKSERRLGPYCRAADADAAEQAAFRQRDEDASVGAAVCRGKVASL